MDQDEIYEDTWEEKNEWLPYPKNDLLSTAFCYAKYSKSKHDITVFGIKSSSILRSLADKHFNSLRDENDEPIYTYNDEFMRYRVRKPKTEEDAQLWVNTINRLFLTKCLILFQQK